jgi:DNA-binding transcriptional ArsR family regulator
MKCGREGIMNRELSPTLWRTCRVLANRQRLLILRCLLRKAPQTVTQIAASLGFGMPLASQYLRMLQARGLIRSDRSGREVFYSDRTDPLVPSAAGLLRVLRSALTSSDASLDEAMFMVTAFTHPRRVLIVRTLGPAGMRVEELRRATGISTRAMRRHLTKLRKRGVLSQNETFVKRSTKGSRLLQCLVRFASAD